MQEVLQIFSGQELLSESRQDPDLRSHPLSRDRLRAIEGYVASYPGTDIPDPEVSYWFERLRAKLSAFTRSPKWTLTQTASSGNDEITLMRRAIALHRQSQSKAAIDALDKAQALRPDDAFLFDLRGQILIESRAFAAAARAYDRGAALAPGNALLLAGLGRAQLASGDIEGALDTLERARDRDFRNSAMLRDLAQTYARAGRNVMAALITAERFALMGRMKDAGLHAERALGQLEEGSGPWQRAQDVLIASKRADLGR
jgi:predicted Zn-dependent protease